MRLPATLLVVTGGIGIGMNLLSILLNLLGIGMRGFAPRGGDERIAALVSGGVGVAMAVLGIVLYAVVVLGGLRMKALQSWGLALAAAIIALLPCCPSCLLGIPVGIWSLVVLLDAEVRAAFR